ncbi:MAG: hypothetical protein GMKNLPBB_00092 [Myxococcota bacterium]|nr:hypothetical protein [Myxococcota bacterium]
MGRTPPRAARIGFALCAGILWLVMISSANNWVFLLDHANLAFHEAGHVFYGMLGTTIGMYGGTFGQLSFPMVLIIRGWIRRHPLETAFGIVWFGQNLVNIAHYAADARSQSLPLVGGGIHDWGWILPRWGLLHRDQQVAGVFRFLGWLTMFQGVLWYCFSAGRPPSGDTPEQVSAAKTGFHSK